MWCCPQAHQDSPPIGDKAEFRDVHQNWQIAFPCANGLMLCNGDSLMPRYVHKVEDHENKKGSGVVTEILRQRPHDDKKWGNPILRLPHAHSCKHIYSKRHRGLKNARNNSDLTRSCYLAI